MEAGAFRGCCTGCPAAGDAVFSVSDQRSYCPPRANHLEMVTAVHLALGKYWFVGRDQLVSVGWVEPMRAQPNEAGVWT